MSNEISISYARGNLLDCSILVLIVVNVIRYPFFDVIVFFITPIVLVIGCVKVNNVIER